MSDEGTAENQEAQTMANVLSGERATAIIRFAVTGDAAADFLAGLASLVRSCESNMPRRYVVRVLRSQIELMKLKVDLMEQEMDEEKQPSQEEPDRRTRMLMEQQREQKAPQCPNNRPDTDLPKGIKKLLM